MIDGSCEDIVYADPNITNLVLSEIGSRCPSVSLNHALISAVLGSYFCVDAFNLSAYSYHWRYWKHMHLSRDHFEQINAHSY